MTTSLQSLQHIQTTTMVKWKINAYRSTYGATPNVQTFLFTDGIRDITTSEGTYVGLGPLLSYSRTKEQIRASGDKVTLGLSGIPATEAVAALASDLKGSEISIFRRIEYPGTNTAITDLDHPRGSNGIVGRFAGFVSTFSINDDIQHESDIRLVEIVLDCINVTGVFRNLARGIRTNPKDLKFAAANDGSFDNVPGLAQQPWYFGKAAK